MLCETQSVSFRIRTRVTVSISCDDKHYTTGTSTEGESVIVHWSIPLCPHGQIHSLDYDWLAGLCIGISMHKYGFNLELFKEMYWVTTCFIFVCQPDASWDPWVSKCYCCYSTLFCTLEQCVRQWSRRPGFNPRAGQTKDFKNATWYPLLKTQQYKVRIEGKVEQSRKRSSALPYNSV